LQFLLSYFALFTLCMSRFPSAFFLYIYFLLFLVFWVAGIKEKETKIRQEGMQTQTQDVFKLLEMLIFELPFGHILVSRRGTGLIRSPDRGQPLYSAIRLF